MEIVNGLLALFDGCYGSLEVATFLSVAAALYVGIKTSKRAVGHGHKKPSWAPFILLLVVAILFIAMMVFKYTRIGR